METYALRLMLGKAGVPSAANARTCLRGSALLAFEQHATDCLLIGTRYPFARILPRNNLFDVSMMERLLENGLPSVELQAQGRMLPGLSKLLKSIYPHLKDNTKITSKLVAPACVASEVFFWHCPHPEEEGERSHVNKRETPACTATFRLLNR